MPCSHLPARPRPRLELGSLGLCVSRKKRWLRRLTATHLPPSGGDGWPALHIPTANINIISRMDVVARSNQSPSAP